MSSKKSRLRLDEKGRMLCTGYTTRGTLCKAICVNGTQFCALHGGGATEVTADTPPEQRVGKYGAYLPPELAATYVRILKDQELLSLKDEIVLTDTYVTDMVKTQTASKRLTPGNIEQTIELLSVQSKHADEINRMLDLRRRLVEAEQKRLVALNGVMTVDQAMLVINAMLTVVQENVEDPVVLERIQGDIRALLYRRDRQSQEQPVQIEQGM